MYLKQIAGCAPLFHLYMPQTKNAFGLTHPQASQVLKFGNLAVLAPIGFRPAVLRRHLSVTLPFRLKTYLV